MDHTFSRILEDGYDDATLLALLTVWARQHHGGHYTIFAFTTGYKVALGTPNLYPGGTAYAQVSAMPPFPTLKRALVHALLSDTTFYDDCTGAVLARNL